MKSPSLSRTLLQWLALLALTVAGVALLKVARVPAGLLLGPMAAGVALAAAGGSIRVPRWPFLLAQGVLGGMIASRFSPSLAAGIARGWKLYLAVTLAVLAASTLLGWILARWRVLPGTTAVWGSSPGAATSMVVMAEEYGADARLVAFMQYLRVVLVAVIAATIAHVVVPPGAMAAGNAVAPFDARALAWTLALVLGGAVLGRVTRIPAGSLLIPFAAAATLNAAGWLTPQLPQWLLAVSYAAIGWTVGLRFTRELLRYALRALPRVLAGILALIGVCGLLALALVRFGGIDPLTAYLATSPGGVDSAAIIAASSGKADLGFVMALQMVRAISVLFLGPYLARWVAARVGGDVVRSESSRA
jgi:membrane AbrB-like protein